MSDLIRPDATPELTDVLSRRILVLDGAMGTMIQGHRLSEQDYRGIIRNACPGPGACGGMYTANTMAAAIEALGMSVPYSSSAPG